MNIALVIYHADPSRGGAEGYTSGVARSLVAAGHSVSLLARDFGPGAEGLPQVQRVEVAASGLTRRAEYLRFLESLDDALNHRNYDIVHAMLPVRRCDFYHPHAGLAVESIDHGHERYRGGMARALARLGTQLNRKRLLFARIERGMMTGDSPPTILCLTERMRRSALAYFPARPEKIVKLFNGIDILRFDPQRDPHAGKEIRRRFNLGDDRVVALIVGQDFARKGVAEAIEAVARVNDPRLALLVVGRDDPARYLRLARSRGIADRVIFTGAAADIYPFYRAADFLLFPARVDPCPLVVLESLAMGVPVIVSRHAGSHEAISDGREGFIIDTWRDLPAFAEAARAMLDPARRAAMADAALQLRPVISHQRHLAELITLYEGHTHEGVRA